MSRESYNAGNLTPFFYEMQTYDCFILCYSSWNKTYITYEINITATLREQIVFAILSFGIHTVCLFCLSKGSPVITVRKQAYMNRYAQITGTSVESHENN